MNHHLTGAMARARHEDLDRAAAARLRRTDARPAPSGARGPSAAGRPVRVLLHLLRRGPSTASAAAVTAAVATTAAVAADAADALPEAIRDAVGVLDPAAEAADPALEAGG